MGWIDAFEPVPQEPDGGTNTGVIRGRLRALGLFVLLLCLVA